MDINQELHFIEQIIKSNFENISFDSIKKFGEGWMNRTYLINNNLVFRFPKEEKGAIDLAKEINSLSHIQKKITLNIPEFSCIGKQPNGFPFVGYSILKGITMNEYLFNSLSIKTKDKIANQIANFIDELSSFPVDTAKLYMIPVNDFYMDYFETFEEIKQTIYPIIEKDMSEYIASSFDSYLRNKNNFSYSPTLLHADLSLNHLIFDKEKQKLSGIIDFGDMVIGDPDYEYIYLLDDCGYEFTKKVMEIRKEKDIENKLEKIKFFLTVDNIGIIQEGIRTKNIEMIEEAIKTLRNAIK